MTSCQARGRPRPWQRNANYIHITIPLLSPFLNSFVPHLCKHLRRCPCGVEVQRVPARPHTPQHRLSLFVPSIGGICLNEGAAKLHTIRIASERERKKEGRGGRVFITERREWLSGRWGTSEIFSPPAQARHTSRRRREGDPRQGRIGRISSESYVCPLAYKNYQSSFLNTSFTDPPFSYHRLCAYATPARGTIPHIIREAGMHARTHAGAPVGGREKITPSCKTDRELYASLGAKNSERTGGIAKPAFYFVFFFTLSRPNWACGCLVHEEFSTAVLTPRTLLLSRLSAVVEDVTRQLSQRRKLYEQDKRPLFSFRAEKSLPFSLAAYCWRGCNISCCCCCCCFRSPLRAAGYELLSGLKPTCHPRHYTALEGAKQQRVCWTFESSHRRLAPPPRQNKEKASVRTHKAAHEFHGLTSARPTRAAPGTYLACCRRTRNNSYMVGSAQTLRHTSSPATDAMARRKGPNQHNDPQTLTLCSLVNTKRQRGG